MNIDGKIYTEHDGQTTCSNNPGQWLFYFPAALTSQDQQ